MKTTTTQVITASEKQVSNKRPRPDGEILCSESPKITGFFSLDLFILSSSEMVQSTKITLANPVYRDRFTDHIELLLKEAILFQKSMKSKSLSNEAKITELENAVLVIESFTTKGKKLAKSINWKRVSRRLAKWGSEKAGKVYSEAMLKMVVNLDQYDYVLKAEL
ncbi:hypothetical protein GIB67_027227 [Kingdonia uniflora]|uniref:Uncharacterized protein n=1 Tax=Kingdonia uniflora TaxID=39325 RepID=A0A7J7KYC3_9MAGN|nr:hypothetical protein GIB67_027227 [Kingdonia uniflora]